MPMRLDLSGQRFGRLTVERMVYGGSSSRAICACDCGGSIEAIAYNIKNGNTTSCGCLLRESRAAIGRAHGPIQGKRNATHGRSHTPTYIAWLEARKRCFKPQNERYRHYGGRGITMCARWAESFEAFFADMGERPAGLSLDRKDNNGNYEPGNCRWATQREQVSNRRSCVYVNLNGEKLTRTEAGRRLGVSDPRRLVASGALPLWVEP